jgi:hypothetical protein
MFPLDQYYVSNKTQLNGSLWLAPGLAQQQVMNIFKRTNTLAYLLRATATKKKKFYNIDTKKTDPPPKGLKYKTFHNGYAVVS